MKNGTIARLFALACQPLHHRRVQLLQHSRNAAPPNSRCRPTCPLSVEHIYPEKKIKKPFAQFSNPSCATDLA